MVVGINTLPPTEPCSIHVEGEKEALRYKWIESEKAGRDLGEEAIRRWVQVHWWGCLRAWWIEHLEGKRFWLELDRNDFGFLLGEFPGEEELLHRILARIKQGQENLDIIVWAHAADLPMLSVLQILEVLDINSRRLACKFAQL